MSEATAEAVVEPPKREPTIVTGETLDAFHAEKLGLDKPEAKEEPKVEPAEAEPEAEGEDKPKKAKNPINERMSELTAQRKQALERAEAAEKRAAEAEAKLAPPKVESVDPGEPRSDQFTDFNEYVSKLTEYRVEKALEIRAQREEAAKVTSSFVERVAQAKAEMPDYEEVVGASTVVVSDPVRDALIKSPVGPKLLYKLATEPEKAAELQGMSVVEQLVTLGEWAAELKRPAAVSAPAPVERKKAPEPITPVRGNKAADLPIDSDGEFTGSIAEYKALRRAGKL